MITAPTFNKKAFRDTLELIRKKTWLTSKEEEIMYLWELCDSIEQQDLLKELMLDIYVLGNDEEEKAANAIDEYIQQSSLTPADTWIVSVADVGKIDGSLSGMQILKQKVKPVSDWIPRYISHIPDVAPKLSNGDNILLFDDFLGSGNKFIKKVNWLLNILGNSGSVDLDTITIHFISFAGMNFGISRLQEKGYNVFVFKSLEKGISDKNNQDDTARKLKVMYQIESKLKPTSNSKNLADFTLGYNKSESLYYWRNNSCPNNVFPVFWWKHLSFDKEHEPLLTRAE
ncbi:hypothetical protein AB4483_19260 [Vibrio splendidus]